MMGAIVGDLIGSRFELDNYAYVGPKLVGAHCLITDETVCVVGLADALIRGADLAGTLRSWCLKYAHVPYGRRFKNWFLDSGMGPYQSLGNGCAVRVAVSQHFGASALEMEELSVRLAQITHNHPESLKVMRVLSQALYQCRTGSSKSQLAEFFNASGFKVIADRESLIKERVVASETAVEVVAPALSAVCAARDFEDCMRICIARGGDVDTIAALAGTFAEHLFGIPKEFLEESLKRLPQEMLEIVSSFR